MAVAGRKPKSKALHIVAGTYRPTRHGKAETPPVLDGDGPQKPKKLKSPVSRVWDRTLSRWTWLTAADSDKLLLYCTLQAEFEKDPSNMNAAKIGHLRNLGSELGGDPVSRTRMNIGPKQDVKKEDKYFPK